MAFTLLRVLGAPSGAYVRPEAVWHPGLASFLFFHCLGFGLVGAGLVHADGLLVLGIVPSFFQVIVGLGTCA